MITVGMNAPPDPLLVAGLGLVPAPPPGLHGRSFEEEVVTGFSMIWKMYPLTVSHQSGSVTADIKCPVVAVFRTCATIDLWS